MGFRAIGYLPFLLQGYRILSIFFQGYGILCIHFLPGIWDTEFNILVTFSEIGDLGKLILGIFAIL